MMASQRWKNQCRHLKARYMFPNYFLYSIGTYYLYYLYLYTDLLQLLIIYNVYVRVYLNVFRYDNFSCRFQEFTGSWNNRLMDKIEFQKIITDEYLLHPNSDFCYFSVVWLLLLRLDWVTFSLLSKTEGYFMTTQG